MLFIAAASAQSPLGPKSGGPMELLRGVAMLRARAPSSSSVWAPARGLIMMIERAHKDKVALANGRRLVAATIVLACLVQTLAFVEAGFFTFYFPNILKPKGFSELTDMIDALNTQISETRDIFSDTQYYWGQMQRLDKVRAEYPEESACSELFPHFRELAISYVYADYEHYIKPFELYKAHLIEFRDKWYPAGLESKAALPREWEQSLHEKELELKIEWLERLATDERFKSQREQLNEIWRSVRRSLDTSVPCIYLRYARRQIAEDINQVALEANLESMRGAMKVLRGAYKRIARYQDSDKSVLTDIDEELKKVERFKIKVDDGT